MCGANQGHGARRLEEHEDYANLSAHGGGRGEGRDEGIGFRVAMHFYQMPYNYYYI